MFKPNKLCLLACTFVFSTVISGMVLAGDSYKAHLSGDGMFMVKKLPVFSFGGPTIGPDGSLSPPELLSLYEHRVPIPTAGTGKLTLKIYGQEIRYRLRVDEENLWRDTLDPATPGDTPGRAGVVHIHLGTLAAKGPIMFEIFNRGTSELVNGSYSGVLTADNLYIQDTFYGENQPRYLAEYGIVNMEDALEAIRRGNTSVVVHTGKHWLGEIGGEIWKAKKLSGSKSSLP